MRTVQLVKAIQHYATTKLTVAVRAADVAAHCSIGLKAAENITRALRAVEAKRGKNISEGAHFTGNVEGDGHGLCRAYVSSSNPHFAKEVKEAIHRGICAKFWPVLVGWLKPW